MRPATTPPHLYTLILLTGTSVLTLNMFVPSLAHMAEDFGVDYGVMSLAIGGYLAMTAVVQVILGPISDLYGRRPVILIGMGVFFVASLICATTSNINVFLAGRAMQCAAATGAALSRASIRDQYDEKESASKIALVATIMAIAPMMGPFLGGLLDAAFGWRANFVFYSAAGLVLFVLVYVDLGETHFNRGTSFTAQFKAYPQLFRSKRFWGYAMCAALSVGTFHIFVSGAPLVAMAAFGLSTAELGLYMGSITLGFMIGTAASSRISKRYELSTMMIAGRLFAIVGLGVPALVIWAGYVSEWLFFGAMIMSGIGNGMTSPNANAGALSIRPHLAGSASGLSAALIVGVGAIVSTLTGAVLTVENGVVLLPVLMVISSVLGLIAALVVRHLNAREAREAAVSGTQRQQEADPAFELGNGAGRNNGTAAAERRREKTTAQDETDT